MVQLILDKALAGGTPSKNEALAFADFADTRALARVASDLRDQGFRNVVTYSKKVFIPLTHLCRDVCHYCTFAQTPKNLDHPFMEIPQVLDVAKQGANLGCKEALFTLGEKPELRYRVAREWLAENGYQSTLDYLAHAARAVYEETGLLPHLNPGNMTPNEIQTLRPVSPSMGIMLESASERLTEKGMPHYGSPDKIPAVRLQTLRDAGAARVPFTTGILIGIGETRRERIESLLAIRDIHQEFGHVQEIIVQNFRAKPGTKMRLAPEPDLDDLLWTIAVTRILFGASMSIQAPPNLSPGVLPQIVDAGINDWGGVSPVTPDFVNPEAPWPHLDELSRETALAGKYLHERLTIYPNYAIDAATWVDDSKVATILDRIGRTSLVPLRHIVPANGARILLKIESENPTGSMKDRMALAMIDIVQVRALHTGLDLDRLRGARMSGSEYQRFVVEAEADPVEYELSKQPSVVALKMKNLKQMPAIGETDLLRSLQLLSRRRRLLSRRKPCCNHVP